MIEKDKLLQEMKDCVGKEEPVIFFQKMVDVFNLLFSKIEQLEVEVKQSKVNAALAINWDPSIAANLIAKQIQVLRQDPDLYASEIKELKTLYNFTYSSSEVFVEDWVRVLGYHPFLDYK
jgi:DNA phosphorothioation-dependent restriction protein DptG